MPGTQTSRGLRVTELGGLDSSWPEILEDRRAPQSCLSSWCSVALTFLLLPSKTILLQLEEQLAQTHIHTGPKDVNLP